MAKELKRALGLAEAQGLSKLDPPYDVYHCDPLSEPLRPQTAFPVFAHLSFARVPTFNLKFSKTIGQKYFASTCPNCGMLSGDFHLHSEPGAPFFPTDEHEAASLYITELPVPARIHARASISMGCGDLILKNATRIR